MDRNALNGRSLKIFIGMLSLLLLVWASDGFAKSVRKSDHRPDRSITMSVEYPGVVIPLEEDLNMDVTFYNEGKSNETVDVKVTDVPTGWQVRMKTYQYTVTAVSVPAGENKNITFEAVQTKDVFPGTYDFLIEANTPDGKFVMKQNVVVTVKEKDAIKKESKGIKLTTSYPVLKGPSDGKFEFSVEVENKMGKEGIFDLFASGPEGWDVSFKPAYESKYISSLRIKENQSSTVAVEVKPPSKAPAGEYPINLKVRSGNSEGSVKLTVNLIGTYDLEAGTPDGVLSLEAWQGKTANISFYIRNTGTAAIHNLKFISVKPENWNVEFKPDKVDILEPDKLEQVEMMITPNKEALLGDYSVRTVIDDAAKVSKDLEFRVMVKTSSTWGWIGIGIIVLVILGLMLLFRSLGRR